MAVEEFQFKIAKAKDLPLSWFELVLCPEKFQDHLGTLARNPSAEPTAVQLIITFLEKANCIEGQAQPQENLAAAKEKRKLLVECALFLAAFLHWDVTTLERSLPPAVQFTLASRLSEAFPLSGGSNGDVPPSAEDPSALTAHVIFSQWLVRFAAQYDLPSPPQRGSTWEVSCATPEQINTLVAPRLPQAVAFLTKACSEPPRQFVLPQVVLELPLNSKGGGEVFRLLLPGREEELRLPADQVLCQLWYDLGVLHFKQEDFSRAHSSFSEADRLLGNPSHSRSRKPHPLHLVDPAKLGGYLSACECVLGRSGAVEGVRGGGVRHKGRSLVERIEELRINNFEDVTDLLIEDVAKRELSSAFRTGLETEALDWSGSMATEPSAKRQKLERDFSRLPLQHRLCICNAVSSMVEGRSARPQAWQLLAEGSKQHFGFLFHVCGKLLQQKESALRKHELQYLQTFVRSVCSSTLNGTEVWKQLLSSEAKSLALPEDLQDYVELLGESPEVVVRDNSPQASDPPLTADHLEREIQLSFSSRELLTAVEQLFKTLPTAEHKTAATKWVGAEEVFAAASAIADPVLLTKYNALVHRALQLKQAKSYATSLDLLQGALQLLSTPPAKVSQVVRQRLAPRLQEQILSLELMAVREHFRTDKSQTHTERSETHTEKSQTETEKPQGTATDSKVTALVYKAKAALKQSGRASLDAVATQVATSFLFNAQQFSFLAAQPQLPSGKLMSSASEPQTFAPKLAAAILCVKQGGDMRKPSRELFEAVLGVFSPPLNSTDSKSEQNERQSKLRSYLDVFVENLVDPTSLSLLLAALARIWNLLEKPEDEILGEFSNNWPTAIGNPGSIDPNHVLRSLNTSLRHGLSVHPRKTSWIVMQSDMYNATKQYGPALEGYMEAGALSSRQFEDEVAAKVWTQQVYQRMIGCCSKLGYHTHAVVFCQFLDPVDYELAFSILRNHSNATMESLFSYFWDMTIIEYLILADIHSKKGDTHKQTIAIQVAGQPELNFNNSSEILERAVQVRRRRFLRTFFKQIIS